MHDELKAASKSPALSALIAVAVARAVALLCHRASALMASGSELRTISGAAVAAQLLNISLCSQLHEVLRSLLMMLPKLAPAAAEVRFCLPPWWAAEGRAQEVTLRCDLFGLAQCLGFAVVLVVVWHAQPSQRHLCAHCSCDFNTERHVLVFVQPPSTVGATVTRMQT
jgi:hypothetical protein